MGKVADSGMCFHLPKGKCCFIRRGDYDTKKDNAQLGRYKWQKTSSSTHMSTTQHKHPRSQRKCQRAIIPSCVGIQAVVSKIAFVYAIVTGFKILEKAVGISFVTSVINHMVERLFKASSNAGRSVTRSRYRFRTGNPSNKL